MPFGLRTLSDLKKEVNRDLRRTGASIALNKSMDARLIRRSPRSTPMAAAGKGMLQATPPTTPSAGAPTTTSSMNTSPGSRPTSQQQDLQRQLPPADEEAPASQRTPERRDSRRTSFGEAELLLQQQGPRRASGERRRSSITQERRTSTQMLPEDIKCLESAFDMHKAAFDLDGDGTISVEELITIFERCHLFNDHFSPEKIRDYFRTWADGCNHHMGLSEPMIGDDGIGFPEFKRVLRWAADMNRIDFERCCAKVVRLSKRLCDKEASVQRRLEVVFDSFCKKHPAHMNAFEFGRLCRKLELGLCMGDVFSLFSELPGGVQGEGVDFAGFVKLLHDVGERLNMGEDIYAAVARGVELLDTDEETINRVKMRMRHSATVVGGTDWRKFFQDCDPDGSGELDWEEFQELCRTKLHLTDKDSHLRLLFERIDQDGSDELSIDELVDFVASADIPPPP